MEVRVKITDGRDVPEIFDFQIRLHMLQKVIFMLLMRRSFPTLTSDIKLNYRFGHTGTGAANHTGTRYQATLDNATNPLPIATGVANLYLDGQCWG